MFLKKPAVIAVIVTILSLSIIGCATILVPPSPRVLVECNVPGVKIYMDGNFVGQTPLVMPVPRFGDHVIRVEAEGYMPKEVKLERTLNIWGWNAVGGAGTAGLLLLGGIAADSAASYDYYDYGYSGDEYSSLSYLGPAAALLLTMSLVDLVGGAAFDYPETLQIILQ